MIKYEFKKTTSEIMRLKANNGKFDKLQTRTLSLYTATEWNGSGIGLIHRKKTSHTQRRA